MPSRIILVEFAELDAEELKPAEALNLGIFVVFQGRLCN
jgi:hypothetical protein